MPKLLPGTETQCPICDGLLERNNYAPDRRVDHNECRTCGEYSITQEANEVVQLQYQDKKWILSGVIRNAVENGKKVLLRAEDIRPLIESAPVPKTPFEAIERLVVFIASRTSPAGDGVPIGICDYPIVFGKNAIELEKYLLDAIRLGHIEKCQADQYRLTLEGWAKVEELKQPKMSTIGFRQNTEPR